MQPCALVIKRPPPVVGDHVISGRTSSSSEILALRATLLRRNPGSLNVVSSPPAGCTSEFSVPNNDGLGWIVPSRINPVMTK